jgi:hypothetical protein
MGRLFKTRSGRVDQLTRIITYIRDELEREDDAGDADDQGQGEEAQGAGADDNNGNNAE